MKKIKMNRSSFEEIPLAIMLDIFLRLVTKTCLNCKLVCKEWYHIITSTEFADLRSSSRATMVLHGKFHSNKYDFMLLDLDESSKIDAKGNLTVSEDAMIRFNSNFGIFAGRLEVVNECNGLICLSTHHHLAPYIVCNLLTGEHLSVKQYWRKSCRTKVFGLGCCPVSRQYKVVRLLKMTKRRGQFNKFEAEIQTLGTNEWRTITGDVPARIHFDDLWPGPCPAFLHGALHMYSPRDKCIWSFDFENERFLRVPTPDKLETTRSRISVFDSCLCFTIFPSYGQCEVWLMKEYGVKASWVKQFVIQLQPRHFLDYPPMPLLRMDTDDILASYGERLVSIVGADDLSLRSWKIVEFQGKSSFMSLAPFKTKFSKIGATLKEMRPKRVKKGVSQS